MATKQQSEIQIGAYFFNGAYRPFPGYPKSFRVWNVEYDAELEFRSSPTNRALSGFERGNVSGHRLNVSVNLRNTSPTQSEELRLLFNLVSSQFPRKLADVTLSSTSATSATFDAGKEAVAGYYNGVYVVQGNNRARVADYTSGRVATLVGDELQDGGAELFVFPDKPTIIGASTDNNTANIIYCNPIDTGLSLLRELTIGTQSVRLELRSVERTKDIPSQIVIQ